MGVLKKNKKKETKKAEKPATPEIELQLAVDATVTSKLVADKDGMHQLNSLTFVSPDMDSNQLAEFLNKLDGCVDDNGIVNVAFYPRSGEDVGEEDQNND